MSHWAQGIADNEEFTNYNEGLLGPVSIKVSAFEILRHLVFSCFYRRAWSDSLEAKVLGTATMIENLNVIRRENYNEGLLGSVSIKVSALEVLLHRVFSCLYHTA